MITQSKSNPAESNLAGSNLAGSNLAGGFLSGLCGLFSGSDAESSVTQGAVGGSGSSGTDQLRATLRSLQEKVSAQRGRAGAAPVFDRFMQTN